MASTILSPWCFRCSRAHPDPEVNNTLLFPGMYVNFKLEQTFCDEYDTGSQTYMYSISVYFLFSKFVTLNYKIKWININMVWNPLKFNSLQFVLNVI